MTQPLLQSKLFIPHLRERVVDRPRFYDQLDDGAARRLTVISAPAGYGKTTLVTSWLAQSDRRVAWVSLDANDSDPTSFFCYLVASIGQHEHTISEQCQGWLYMPSPPPLKNLLTTLINLLAEIDAPLEIVFDDYHLIDFDEVHEGVHFLINHLPPLVHVTIISRREMPFSLANLRAKAQMVEITLDDLRFTLEESGKFLRDVMALTLSEEAITDLNNKTEGWVTSLQLAALTLQRSASAGSTIDAISGQSRYIADYLMDEVLAQLPEEIHQFLLRTCVLERLSVSLCDAVAGIDNSWEILNALERANLFLIPLDNRREWYRYHHLFAEFLQHRLESSPDNEASVLHKRASDWYLAHGRIEEAINHALASKDYELAISRIVKHTDEFLAQGKFRPYLAWIDQIPQPYLGRSPLLLLCQAFMLYEMGNFPGSDLQMKHIRQMLPATYDSPDELSEAQAEQLGIWCTIRAIQYASQTFDILKGRQYSEQALTLLPERLAFWRWLAIGAVAFGHRVRGEFQLSIDRFKEAAKINLENGIIFGSYVCLAALARLYLQRGDLGLALEACEQALDLDRQTGMLSVLSGHAHLLMGEILYHRDELETAKTQTQRGLELAVQHGEVYTVIHGYFIAALIELAAGQTSDALKLMQAMQIDVQRMHPDPNTLKTANARQALIWIRAGMLQEAANWRKTPGFDTLISDKPFSENTSFSYTGIYRVPQVSLEEFQDLIRIASLEFQLASGHAHAVLQAAATHITLTKQKEWYFYTLHYLILKAIAHHQLGQHEFACDSLREALQLAVPEGFVQFFLERGPDIQQLLLDYLAAEPLEEDADSAFFVNRILEQLEYSTPGKMPDQPTYQTITPRELDVLNCLAQGLTYSEAAEQLSISINTLKSYIKRSYSKLGVTNRTQALNKLKELNFPGFHAAN